MFEIDLAERVMSVKVTGEGACGPGAAGLWQFADAV